MLPVDLRRMLNHYSTLSEAQAAKRALEADIAKLNKLELEGNAAWDTEWELNELQEELKELNQEIEDFLGDEEDRAIASVSR